MSQFYLRNGFYHPKLNITTYSIKVIRKLHLKIIKKKLFLSTYSTLVLVVEDISQCRALDYLAQGQSRSKTNTASSCTSMAEDCTV